MPTSTKKSKKSRRAPVGRKPKDKKDGGLQGAMARLRPARKSTRARKSSNTRLDRIAAGAGVRTRPLRPSRKGLVGIAAGAGLGGVAMAKRRRRPHEHKAGV